jgi:hypothetical protein
MESMRTHGLAQPTVYENFHRVIHAINSHPALAITCDNSFSGLQSRADDLMGRSSYDIFQYCTGAIDGL